MSLSFTPSASVKTECAMSKDDACAAIASLSDGVDERGTSPTTSCDDLRRELSIQQAGRDMARHMAELAAINARTPHTFADLADAAAPRWRATLARQRMEFLIGQRSPEQVARMQRESDERMAREPGGN